MDSDVNLFPLMRAGAIAGFLGTEDSLGFTYPFIDTLKGVLEGSHGLERELAAFLRRAVDERLDHKSIIRLVLEEKPKCAVTIAERLEPSISLTSSACGSEGGKGGEDQPDRALFTLFLVAVWLGHEKSRIFSLWRDMFGGTLV